MFKSFSLKRLPNNVLFKRFTHSLSRHPSIIGYYSRIYHTSPYISQYTNSTNFPSSFNFNLNYNYSTLKAVVPESYSPEESDTVESIKMLIEKRIRPVIQQDGGDVSFVSFDSQTGFVYVRLSGACVGCVQSDITLKHMIQDMLCHYLDEITAVYNVDEDNNVVTSDTNNEL